MLAVRYEVCLLFLLMGCNIFTQDISDEKYRELDVLIYDINDTTMPLSKKTENLDFVFDEIRKTSYSKDVQVRVFKVANRYFNLRLFGKYKDVVDYSLIENSKIGDTINIAKSLFYLGDYYHMTHKPDSALFFYKNSKEVYKTLKDDEKIGEVLLQMSTIKTHANDWVGGEKLAIQALKYFKGTNSVEKTAFVYNTLGVISINLGDFPEAIKMLNTGLEVLQDITCSPSLYYREFLTLNLAVALGEVGRKKEALVICEKLLRDKKTYIYDMPELYAGIIAKRAELQYKLKVGNGGSDVNFKHAITILDSLSFPSNSIPVRIHLSEFYLSNKDTINSFKVAHEAYKLSQSHKDRSLHVLSLQQLINSDPENAAQYSKQYVALNDSIQIAERKIINKFARIEFETDQLRKERDDAVTTNDLFYQILIIFFILFLSYFYFIYRKFGLGEIALRVIRKKYELELFEQASTQQQDIMVGRIIEKTRISRDLHDGVLNDLALIRNRVLMVLDNKSSNLEGKWTACKKFISRLQIVEKEIHAISHGLNTNPILKGIKFRKLVDELFRVEVEKGELKWRFEHDKSIKWKTKDKELKLDIYRTLQEVIKNINKHSNASSVLVRIKGEDNAIIITAADNGDGFKDDVAKANGGVANIRARVAKHGGQFDIQSDAGKGVKIFLVFSF